MQLNTKESSPKVDYQKDIFSSKSSFNTFTPVETPFKKPFKSTEWVEKTVVENAVVYDSLKDNRFCGVMCCD